VGVRAKIPELHRVRWAANPLTSLKISAKNYEGTSRLALSVMPGTSCCRSGVVAEHSRKSNQIEEKQEEVDRGENNRFRDCAWITE
jgi:hypothetical protein